MLNLILGSLYSPAVYTVFYEYSPMILLSIISICSNKWMFIDSFQCNKTLWCLKFCNNYMFMWNIGWWNAFLSVSRMLIYMMKFSQIWGTLGWSERRILDTAAPSQCCLCRYPSRSLLIIIFFCGVLNHYMICLITAPSFV